ncbi:hypothetical protein [Pantoea sp. BAV 3049]|uniref:hypothetical protein n=1 Tax=Pantoea sp. BAV 3049 TaxID=2654188 RepID=UPI00131A932E|nr:hypothetical protein [Pantoea sp. BAV 3049]
MIALTTFEESEHIAEQLHVILEVVDGAGEISEYQKAVLTGIALNLSGMLLQFCGAGAKDESQL